jgi:hypothetical protein
MCVRARFVCVRRAVGVATSLTFRLNKLEDSTTFTGFMIWHDDPAHDTWK